MASESQLNPATAADLVQGRIRRRRSPSPREQARREAWGRTWGSVGAEYKRQRLAREA